jgi:hypothetical protein
MKAKKEQAPDSVGLEVKAEAPIAAPSAPQDEPVKAEAIAPAEPVATPAKAEPRYRVWPHGNLLADGQLFKAGEDVPYGLRNEPCVEEY